MGTEAAGTEGRPNGADAGAAGGLRDLARERFGSLLTAPPPGDPPTTEGLPDDDEDRAAATSGDAGVSSPAEDAQAAREDDEGAAAEGQDPEPGEAGAEAGEGDASFGSLHELFEAAGLTPDKAGALPVRIKVDGRESEVPLSELVANHQIRSAADQRLAEAKERAKALDQELSTKSSQAEAQLAQTAKLLERAEARLGEETKGIDWATLRTEDPAEYSAKKAEVAERRAEIDRLKREAVETYQSAAEQHRKEQEKQHQERLAQEQAALLEHLPEWRDEAKARDEKGRLAQYLMAQGFTPQDVQGAADHRLVLLARKAMLYDEGRKGAAQKKVAPSKRVLRPGTRPSQEQQSRERVERALSEHRKRGTIDSAFAALRAKRGDSHGAARRNVRHQ